MPQLEVKPEEIDKADSIKVDKDLLKKLIKEKKKALNSNEIISK